MKYEIRYDYCAPDANYDEKDLIEEFEGEYLDLETHLKQMREQGCYHIAVSAMGQ